jgi:hypothetical protein
MGLGKQRTVYVSVLGLAMVGLCVDRFVLGSGADAPTRASDLLVASGKAAETLAGTVGSLLSGERKDAPSVSPETVMVADLARSLRELGVDNSMLASLPETFALAKPKAEPAPVAAPVAPIGEPPLVTAILHGGSSRAIAGGKSVAVGSEVGGWDVVFVGNGRVVFERDGHRFERKVHRPPAMQAMLGEE